MSEKWRRYDKWRQEEKTEYVNRAIDASGPYQIVRIYEEIAARPAFIIKGDVQRKDGEDLFHIKGEGAWYWEEFAKVPIDDELAKQRPWVMVCNDTDFLYTRKLVAVEDNGSGDTPVYIVTDSMGCPRDWYKCRLATVDEIPEDA